MVTGASAPGDSAQWRVVAFTYNREAQATQKAQTIAARHPGLKPAGVFAEWALAVPGNAGRMAYRGTRPGAEEPGTIRGNCAGCVRAELPWEEQIGPAAKAWL